MITDLKARIIRDDKRAYSRFNSSRIETRPDGIDRRTAVKTMKLFVAKAREIPDEYDRDCNWIMSDDTTMKIGFNAGDYLQWITCFSPNNPRGYNARSCVFQIIVSPPHSFDEVVEPVEIAFSSMPLGNDLHAAITESTSAAIRQIRSECAKNRALILTV